MRRVDNHWAALVARCDESGSGTSFRGVCDQRPLDRILAKPFAAANLLDALRGMPHRGAALNG